MVKCPTGRHRGPHTDGTGGRASPCRKDGWGCLRHDCSTDGCLALCPGCKGTGEVGPFRWAYWKVRRT